MSEKQYFVNVASDEMIEKLGLIPANVYGKIWRYAQGKDGVCRATIERMAKELHISRSTFERCVKKLEAAGYVTDKTPELRNRPHLYAVAHDAISASLRRTSPSERRTQSVTLTHEDSNKIVRRKGRFAPVDSSERFLDMLEENSKQLDKSEVGQNDRLISTALNLGEDTDISIEAGINKAVSAHYQPLWDVLGGEPDAWTRDMYDKDPEFILRELKITPHKDIYMEKTR